MMRSHAVLFKHTERESAIYWWYTHVLVFIQLVIIATRHSNGTYKQHTLLLLHPLFQICAVFIPAMHEWSMLRKTLEAKLIIFILMCEQVRSSCCCCTPPTSNPFAESSRAHHLRYISLLLSAGATRLTWGMRFILEDTYNLPCIYISYDTKSFF